MNHYTMNVACAVLALAGTGLAHAGTTAPLRWTMDTLERGDDLKLVVVDINEQGQSTGYITDHDWQTRPFIRLEGGIIDYPEVTWGRGMKMLDSGEAIGHGMGNLLCRLTADGPVVFASTSTSAYSWIAAMNSSGSFCMNQPGVIWTAEGGAESMPDTYMLDMNESGDVAGRTADTAFVRRNGELLLLDGDYAHSIDEDGQVLLSRRNYPDYTYVMLDLDTGEEEQIIEITQTANGSPICVANDSGMVAFSWIEEFDGQQPEKAHLVFWTQATGLVELDLPEETGFVLFEELTESGLIAGRAVSSESYESSFFLASMEHGYVDLSERTIGFDDSIFINHLTAINESGQIALKINGDLPNAHYSVILSPARAGDADGDGTVGVNDLLQVIANWGVCESDSPCDADLNLDGVVDVNDLLTCIGDWD